MFAKIKSGCTPDGLVDYANNEIEKDAKLIDSQGVLTTNNKAMAASFALQAKSNTKVKKFVGHTVIAFSPEDRARMTDELMLEIAKKYMRWMGIVSTQYAIFRHYDQKHDHIHIIYNRVDNDGQQLKNDKNVKASIAITQKLTREYGLTFGKGKEKVNRDRLKGRDKVKYRFYDDIRPIVKEATSWSQFKKMLEKIDYTFILHYSDEEKEGQQRKVKGISFSNGKTSFSGRQLDRSMTYFSIDLQLKINAAREESLLLETEYAKMRTSHIDKTTSETSGGGSDTDTEQSQEAAASQSSGDTSAGDSGAASSIEEIASDINSSASVVGESIIAAVDIATTIHPSVGGGGGSSSKLDDDDKKKRKQGRHR